SWLCVSFGAIARNTSRPMADSTKSVQVSPASFDWSSASSAARRKRRYAAETRLKWYGAASIVIAIGLLGILLASLFYTGYRAFVQTHVAIEITVSAEHV